MTLPNPTVTYCAHCDDIIRYIQNRVGHPPVKADTPPSLPSLPKAAASPVPDLRDGIFLADDDGDSLTFDVRLVMTVPTTIRDGARVWNDAQFICGGTREVARLSQGIGQEPEIVGHIGREVVKAIEAEIAARQPRKGDEK